MVSVWFPFYMYDFICARGPFPFLITVAPTLWYKWSVASSWATALNCEIITITYECRQPNVDVDANQQQVLKLTPSCAAAVGVLMNGQALSMQALRSALTHFAICLLDLQYYINCVFAHVGRALFQVRFFQVPTLMPFPTQTCFTTGQYSPNFVS